MQELAPILLDKGIKPTAMRLIIYDHLLKQQAAQSLTDMELAIGSADRVTLFRTIRTFEESGLVHRIDDGTGVTKFSLCSENCSADGHQDLHVHFYCEVCKETHCLPAITIPEPRLPSAYVPKKTQLTVIGTCPACAT